MHICKFCNKEFEKGIQLGGHIIRCPLNPKKPIKNKHTNWHHSKETKKECQLKE